jgi:lauroyl/myristoyl acyltransferase
MTFCESLHLGAATKEDVRDYVSIEGLEHLQNAHASCNGVILLTAHFGNWELLGARLGAGVFFFRNGTSQTPMSVWKVTLSRCAATPASR